MFRLLVLILDLAPQFNYAVYGHASFNSLWLY